MNYLAVPNVMRDPSMSVREAAMEAAMEPVKAGLRMLSLMLRMKEEDRTEWQVPLQAEKGKGIALPWNLQKEPLLLKH